MDRERNDAADKLAVKGPQRHAVPEDVRRWAVERQKLTDDAHRMFLEILAERAHRRAPGEAGDDGEKPDAHSDDEGRDEDSPPAPQRAL